MKKAYIEIFDVAVYLAETKKDLNKMSKMFNNTNITEDIFDESNNGLSFKYKGDYYLMVHNNTISTLSHEVLHAVIGMCNYRGIEDEETHCYLMTFIMKKFLGEKDKFGRL
ncbi:MAG TPA: hypothetical protein VJU85_05135 [Nitrososphaeraceae archaeon]|nr:hypothetical protein [Nitrososphaeraceae archaeon]